MATLGVKFLKASLIYFILSVIAGVIFDIKPMYDIVMSTNYMKEFHSHLSLIGWVSMALMGLMYTYLEGKGIKYNESMGSKGYIFLLSGAFMMPIMLLLTGLVHIYSIYRMGIYIISDTPMIGLVMISAVIVTLGAYMSAYNIYAALGD